MWHTVHVGNNTFVGRTTSHTAFKVAGSRLFEVRTRGGSGLLMDGELFDSFGMHLGSVTNNRWERKQAEAVVRTQLDRVQVCDTASQVPMLDLWTVGAELVVGALAMSSRDGRRCEFDEAGALETFVPRIALPHNTLSNRVIHTGLDSIDLGQFGAVLATRLP